MWKIFSILNLWYPQCPTFQQISYKPWFSCNEKAKVTISSVLVSLSAVLCHQATLLPVSLSAVFVSSSNAPPQQTAGHIWTTFLSRLQGVHQGFEQEGNWVWHQGKELARPGGPCSQGGSGGMLPRKILNFYSCRDVFSCILKLQTMTFNNQKKITFLDNLIMIWITKVLV